MPFICSILFQLSPEQYTVALSYANTSCPEGQADVMKMIAQVLTEKTWWGFKHALYTPPGVAEIYLLSGLTASAYLPTRIRLFICAKMLL